MHQAAAVPSDYYCLQMLPAVCPGLGLSELGCLAYKLLID